MKSPIGQFLTRLHREHLKPKGFSKKAREFSRERNGYTEIYAMSGLRESPIGAEALWGFYVHAHVFFPDLPPPILGLGKCAAHWAIHAEILAGKMLHPYELFTGCDEEALARELAELIDVASERIVARIPAIRADTIRINHEWALRLQSENDPFGVLPQWRAMKGEASRPTRCP